jgi:hypothetical protein
MKLKASFIDETSQVSSVTDETSLAKKKNDGDTSSYRSEAKILAM